MSKIELRLSDIPPPEPEPTRTIYRDIVNLPDPMLLGLTIRAFNYDDVDLYFQITGSHPDYTFQTVNLGLVGSGANIYRNLDEFASRPRPAVETVEAITLVLKAYEDSGYTQLKHTYERSVMVVIIHSGDGSWTTDVLNSFDDGTVQGWAVANEKNNVTDYPKIAAVTDFVLSPPYSCKMTQRGGAQVQIRARLYKSFTTPDKNYVYAIIDLRFRDQADNYTKFIRTQRNTTVLVFLGRPYDSAAEAYITEDKWMRIVIPLPRNTTLEIRIVHSYHQSVIGLGNENYLWIDDFKIISKD